MLVYAWDLVDSRDLGKFDTEASPNLLGLLAQVLVDSTQILLRRQLGREYKKTISKVNGVRGRIRFSDSLKYIGNKESKLVCEFNELNIDTDNNRIIRSTLNRLVQDRRVKSHNSERIKTLQHQMRTMVREMEGVALVQLSNAHFTSVQVRRDNQHYVLPLKICALIHQLRIPTETAGDAPLAELVRNKTGLPNLFEKFVRNFYRYHISEKYRVGSRNLDWPIVNENQLVPQMTTDISIDSLDYPWRRLIIDTKFYHNALRKGLYGGLRFIEQNLYQIYAYLRTQEEKGEAYRDARGMLLYPTTGYELDEKIQVQGHDIRIVTLNLAEPWEHIETRLLSFI